MNQVPYLGSYGHVPPVVPTPSIGKRMLGSHYLLIGLILLAIGLIVYAAAKQEKERETQLALEKSRLAEKERNDRINQNRHGYDRFNFRI